MLKKNYKQPSGVGGELRVPREWNKVDGDAEQKERQKSLNLSLACASLLLWQLNNDGFHEI